MGDPDKEHAVTLRHPQTKGDRLAKGEQKIKVIAAAPSQKSAGVVMSDKLPPAAV
jgi:organic hydroperoxide reductase OsmC/OhrA